MEKKVNIVNNKINLRSIDRSRKDVKTWRAALRAAESVTMPSRSHLYDVYEDVLLDGHLTGVIAKRIDSVLNKQLLFKHGQTVVAEMQQVVNSKVFRDIVTELMMSIMWGISGMEFLPGDKLAFCKLPRRHIKPRWQIIALEEFAVEGVSYKDAPNIWIVGEPDDLGLLLKCSFYALLKKGNISDWATYIELFGSPIMIMRYDAADLQTDQALDKVLEEAGNSMRIKIPRQADFELKDGKASNCDGNLQETFRNAMNAEMSTIILGNTETTTSSDSSGYAQSRVHADQQMQITRKDMVMVLDHLNSPHFMNILRSYGLPVDGGCFEYDREADIAYMAEKIAIDKIAHDMGLPISHEYLYSTYGITK